MSKPPYHFEVLPFHPRPKLLESFSSYLLRVAEGNSISSINQLSTVTGTRQAYQTKQPDTAPQSFGNMPHELVITEYDLLATTFYYLGAKFGRKERNQRLGRFLNGSVARNLRFCPLCLAQKNYYSLAWRFTLLAGCPEHECRLVDFCWKCGAVVPLFVPPLKLGICPSCDADLRESPAQPLVENELMEAKGSFITLNFLLSPHILNSEATEADIFGTYLAFVRKTQGLLIKDVANTTGLSTEVIKGIETSDLSSKRGEKFHHYVLYIKYLGCDFEDLFNLIVSEIDQHPEKAGWTVTQWYEDYLIQRVYQVKCHLEALGIAVTQAEIAASIDSDVPTLRYYPRVRLLLEEITNEERLQTLRQNKEAQLLEQAHAAITLLRERGERISEAAIGRIMGRAAEGFRLYPQLKLFLQSEIEASEQWQEKLLRAVMTAKEQLEASGELVTQEAIGRAVGMSVEGLKRYPSIAPAMNEIAANFANYNRQRGDQVLQSVKSCVQDLIALNQPVTQENISACVELSIAAMKHYPAVKEILHQVALQYRDRNKALIAAEKEDRMIKEMYAASTSLHERGIGVTREAILKAISVSSRKISRYSSAREVLKSIVKDSKS